MQTLVKTPDKDYIFSSKIHITCFREKKQYVDNNNQLLDTSQYDTIYIDKSSTQNNTVIVADNRTNILSNVDNAISELLEKLTSSSNIVNKYNDTSIWQICATGDHESIVSDLKGHPEYKFFIFNDHFIPAKPSDFKDSTGFDKINDELYKIYNEKLGYHRLAWYKYNHTEPQGTVTLQQALYNSGYGNLLPKSDIQVYDVTTWQMVTFADYARWHGSGWKLDIHTASDYTPLVALGNSNSESYIGGSTLAGKENYIVPNSVSIIANVPTPAPTPAPTRCDPRQLVCDEQEAQQIQPVVPIPKYWRIQTYDSKENHSSGSPYGLYMPSNVKTSDTELLSILSATYADIDVLDYLKLAIIKVANENSAYGSFQRYLHIPHIGKFFHGYTNPRPDEMALFAGRSPFPYGDPNSDTGNKYDQSKTGYRGDCYRKQLKLSVLELASDNVSIIQTSKQYQEDHQHLVFKFIRQDSSLRRSLNGIYIDEMSNLLNTTSYGRHKFSEKYLARTWPNTRYNTTDTDCDVASDPDKATRNATLTQVCKDDGTVSGRKNCNSDGYGNVSLDNVGLIDCGVDSRCKRTCKKCWWATSNGIDCDAFPERIECACSRCSGPKNEVWGRQRYTWDTSARQNYWVRGHGDYMGAGTIGSDKTICNLHCKNVNNNLQGYCSHPESMNAGTCCSCSSTSNSSIGKPEFASATSWDQPSQGVTCKDLISDCDKHKKDGGCLWTNKDHDYWRRACVYTCGYCNDSRYNPNAPVPPVCKDQAEDLCYKCKDRTDLGQTCQQIKDNGGCLDQNPNHIYWKTVCPETCGGKDRTDLGQTCQQIKDNGGCLEQNDNYKHWRAVCPQTCGVSFCKPGDTFVKVGKTLTKIDCNDLNTETGGWGRRCQKTCNAYC